MKGETFDAEGGEKYYIRLIPVGEREREKLYSRGGCSVAEFKLFKMKRKE